MNGTLLDLVRTNSRRTALPAACRDASSVDDFYFGELERGLSASIGEAAFRSRWNSWALRSLGSIPEPGLWWEYGEPHALSGIWVKRLGDDSLLLHGFFGDLTEGIAEHIDSVSIEARGEDFSGHSFGGLDGTTGRPVEKLMSYNVPMALLACSLRSGGVAIERRRHISRSAARRWRRQNGCDMVPVFDLSLRPVPGQTAAERHQRLHWRDEHWAPADRGAAGRFVRKGTGDDELIFHPGRWVGDPKWGTA